MRLSDISIDGATTISKSPLHILEAQFISLAQSNKTIMISRSDFNTMCGDPLSPNRCFIGLFVAYYSGDSKYELSGWSGKVYGMKFIVSDKLKRGEYIPEHLMALL